MSFIGAIESGLRRALRAKRMAVALWLVSLLVALPVAWTMGAILEKSIGTGLVQEKLKESFDFDWYWKFSDEAGGIATTFTPSVVGAGAFYDNLQAWVTGDMFEAFPGLVALGILYALLWTFLMGGVLERLARPEERASLPGFVQAGGRYFYRFVRLTIFTAVPYLLIYLASRWFYDRLEFLTRDVTREWTIFTLSLLTLAATSLLLVVVHIASDYAKIATVVEEKRGMLRALVGGFRFVLAHPGAVLGIYYGIALVGVILLAIYAMLAPGAGQSTIVGVSLAFLAGQVFLFARLALRLTLLGSQTAFFQATPKGGSR
jgi:hypothetical protein